LIFGVPGLSRRLFIVVVVSNIPGPQIPLEVPAPGCSRGTRVVPLAHGQAGQHRPHLL